MPKNTTMIVPNDFWFMASHGNYYVYPENEVPKNLVYQARPYDFIESYNEENNLDRISCGSCDNEISRDKIFWKDQDNYIYCPDCACEYADEHLDEHYNPEVPNGVIATYEINDYYEYLSYEMEWTEYCND